MLVSKVAACIPVLVFAVLNSMVAQTTGPTLVGAWAFTATPETKSDVAPPSIEGLATFTSDGTVAETDTMSIVGRISPGHGIWQRGPIPGGYFFVRYLSLRPNPNGTMHSKLIMTMFLTVNSTGDQFSGPYDIQVLDGNGDTMSTSKGAVDGSSSLILCCRERELLKPTLSLCG
jgi:hypothetical protein